MVLLAFYSPCESFLSLCSQELKVLLSFLDPPLGCSGTGVGAEWPGKSCREAEVALWQGRGVMKRIRGRNQNPRGQMRGWDGKEAPLGPVEKLNLTIN